MAVFLRCAKPALTIFSSGADSAALQRGVLWGVMRMTAESTLGEG